MKNTYIEIMLGGGVFLRLILEKIYEATNFFFFFSSVYDFDQKQFLFLQIFRDLRSRWT